MASKVVKGLNSKIKVSKKYDTFDYWFATIFLSITIVFSIFVVSFLQILFVIYMIILFFYLRGHSVENKNRRNIHSIYFMLTKDTRCYRSYYKEKGEGNVYKKKQAK